GPPFSVVAGGCTKPRSCTPQPSKRPGRRNTRSNGRIAAGEACLHCSGKPGEPGCVSAGRTRGANATPLAILPPVLTRERLRQLVFGNDDDALFGDLEAATAVLLEVVTDGCVRRNSHVLIDDGPADATVPAHIYTFE